MIAFAVTGCATGSGHDTSDARPLPGGPVTESSADPPTTTDEGNNVRLAALNDAVRNAHDDAVSNDLTTSAIQPVSQDITLPLPDDSTRDSLERIALDQNPRLVQLYREYQAAAARSRYVDRLPDPKLGANVFGAPLETASGSQRANLSINQMIPWLGRLNAQQQQACFEALAIAADYESERLQVLSQLRSGWLRLYVLDQQIEVTTANQQLLESLTKVANGRVAAGRATQGDVLLGTLELSKLEERVLVLRRRRQSVTSEINRLVGRHADTPIDGPDQIDVGIPAITSREILQQALESQPAIQAARLRTQATRWGLEVARLNRRPDFTLSANYFVTDDNRPTSTIVGVGDDPWSVGLQVSVPLWADKYDAMEQEAGWKHSASHDSLESIEDRLDSLIVDLVAETNRAAETARLYRQTILPQARQTLEADQQAYANLSVEFDRVMQGFRNLLTLELGYHEAIGDLGIAVTHLRQAAGTDIPLKPLAQAN